MKTKIWLALLALYIVWGSTYLAIRFSVETIPPFLHASIRFLISGVILYSWRRMAGDTPPTRGNWKSTAIVGTALLLGGNGLVALAEKTVPSGIAALMISTSPFWLVLFESFRTKLKPNRQIILGLIVGFTGVFILIGPAEITGGEGSVDRFGAFMLLLAPIFWSMGSIYARGADLPKSNLLGTGMEMLMGAVSLFVVSVITGELNGFSFAQVSTRSWLGLLYLITFGSLVGFVSYGWLLQNAPISLTSTYAYVNPMVAVFLGYFLAGEELSGRILIASIIIVGSVILINRARTVKPRTEPQPAIPEASEHSPKFEKESPPAGGR